MIKKDTQEDKKVKDNYPIRVCVLMDIVADTPAQAYSEVHRLMATLGDDKKLDGWETADNDWYGTDGEPLTEDEVLDARREYFHGPECDECGGYGPNHDRGCSKTTYKGQF